jgi:hypothetical protein
VSEVFRTMAPVRLDFAGGWTDVPPFSAFEGGVVVSAAIGLFAHAEVRPVGAGIGLVSEDLGASLELPDYAALSPTGPLALLQAGLRILPVGPCVLTTRSDAPHGSGLGSSGALGVAMVGALTAARGETPDAHEIAHLACRLESVEAGIPGGRQDQYTAAFGGFLRSSAVGRRSAARARRGSARRAGAPDAARLHRRLRFSSATIEQVIRLRRATARDRALRPACGGRAHGGSASQGDIAHVESCSMPTGVTSRRSTPPCARR